MELRRRDLLRSATDRTLRKVCACLWNNLLIALARQVEPGDCSKGVQGKSKDEQEGTAASLSKTEKQERYSANSIRFWRKEVERNRKPGRVEEKQKTE